MNQIKDISYLGKDFKQFRKNLIDFSKQYFPNTYTDFNESSPGMLFIEMASYVGDVLSYYADNNIKESILDQATEQGNIFDLANTLGYKPKKFYSCAGIIRRLPIGTIDRNRGQCST